jgi:nitrous oxidase accessory protein NosD
MGDPTYMLGYSQAEIRRLIHHAALLRTITRHLLCILTFLTLSFFGIAAFAQTSAPVIVDCSRGDSLQGAVFSASPNSTLKLQGACTGPVIITTNGLKLDGGGLASVTGNGKDVITVNGAQQVLLDGLVITGGGNGIVAQNEAQVTLQK